MKKKIQTLYEFMSVGNASICGGNNINNEIFKFIGTSYFFAFYYFNKKQAIKDTKKSYLNSNFDLSRKVWNLLDTSVIKSGYKGFLGAISNIKFRLKLFLKKTERTITIEILKEIHDKINSGIISNENFDKETYFDSENEGKLYLLKRDKTLAESKNHFFYF